MVSYDVAVVGGGLVGAASAYGLVRAGAKVVVIDEGDVAFRAARSNFGLVWVQGKGVNFTPYAHWSRQSSELWDDFAVELKENTGIDMAHRHGGGLDILLDDAEFDERSAELSLLRDQCDGKFDYEMLDNRALQELLPVVSREVRGASFSRFDGDANPLFLLRALHEGMQRAGGRYHPEGPVTAIEKDGAGFSLTTPKTKLHAERVVLAAGLGNRELAPMVGLAAPLKANRGQVLVSERVQPFMPLPSVLLRQSEQGSVLMGDTHEEVGLNDGTTSQAMKAIAGRAVATFPFLKSVRLVRSWGALRIMTPDGVPIYDESISHPGAYLAVCHSGVTLAAIHADRLPGWILGSNDGADDLGELGAFSARRFDVQAVA